MIERGGKPGHAHRPGLRTACALAMAGLLSACASLPPAGPANQGLQRAFDRVELAGQTRDLEWTLPPPSAQGPRAWLLLQHGFARRCANLRGTAAALAEQGVAVLCINADLAAEARGGADGLAQALAAWWLSPSARSPDGQAAPQAAVLAGHSAGAAFATRVAAALALQASHRVKGVLLFDPVGGPSFARDLQALAATPAAAQRPRLEATLAPPVPCNAGQQALSALRAAGVHAVQPAGATHLDAEGEDSESLPVWACREGPPQAAVVAATRRWAAEALAQMLR